MAKKRILEKLKLTEISGVDRPAQEGATVAIMKRHDGDDLIKLEDRILILQDKVDVLKKMTRNKTKETNVVQAIKSFDALAAEIRKRDGCSTTAALSQARRENPTAFDAYRAPPTTQSTVIAKKGRTPFEDVVDSIMTNEKVTRAVALSRARREHPLKFEHYQDQ